MGWLLRKNFLKIFLLLKFLQCCVGFCHTAIRVSHTYTYSPSFVSLFSPDSTPPSHHRVPNQAPCVVQQLLASCWRVCQITGHVALNAIPLFPRKQAPDWKYYFRLTKGQSARQIFPFHHIIKLISCEEGNQRTRGI